MLSTKLHFHSLKSQIDVIKLRAKNPKLKISHKSNLTLLQASHERLMLILRDTGLNLKPSSEDTNSCRCFSSFSQANFSKAIAERAGKKQGGWRRGGGKEGRDSPPNTRTSPHHELALLQLPWKVGTDFTYTGTQILGATETIFIYLNVTLKGMQHGRWGSAIYSGSKW